MRHRLTRSLLGFVVVLPAACDESPGASSADASSVEDVSLTDQDVREARSPLDDGGDCDSALDQASDRDVDDAAGPDSRPTDARDEADARTNPYSFEPIALEGNPAAVTEVRFIPGSPDQFLLLDKIGTVRHYRLAGSSATLLGSFTVSGVYSEADCGLLSLAFDPDYVDNGFIYLGYCISLQYSRISRHALALSDGGSIGDGTEVITVGDPTAIAAWHNVGSIGFDGDRNLWAVFGDKALTGSSQDTQHNLGALIRIVPSTGDGGAASYTVPASNPFANDPTRSHAIYAYGLRSPWRAALDSHGRYWIGDVGESTFEEIDVVSRSGQNLGWPMWEGPCLDSCGDTLAPVASWNRSLADPRALEDPRTEGDGRRVAWVGREYVDRGNDRYRAGLNGKMLYGDFCAGWVRAMSVDTEGGVASDERLGHLEAVTSWDQADDGYLYAVTYGSCYAFPYQLGGLWRLRREE